MIPISLQVTEMVNIASRLSDEKFAVNLKNVRELVLGEETLDEEELIKLIDTSTSNSLVNEDEENEWVPNLDLHDLKKGLNLAKELKFYFIQTERSARKGRNSKEFKNYYYEKLERSLLRQWLSVGTEKNSNFVSDVENFDKHLVRDSGRGNLNGAEILKRNSATYGKKIYKNNESTKMCEGIMELKKGSVKWSEIQRTLQWMRWLLASGKLHLGKCYKKKSLKKKFSSLEENKNVSFPLSKKVWERRNLIRQISRNKKRRKAHVAVSKTKDLLNSTKSNIYGQWKKKIWKEHKYKVKSLRNRFEREKKKHDREDTTNFRIRDSKKNFKFLGNTELDNVFLKPNSVLQEFKKNFKCQIEWINQDHSSLPKLKENCTEVRQYPDRKKFRSNHVANVSLKITQNSGSDSKKPKIAKNKNWPHFIYHRVSSNFLHPQNKNESNRPSAYVAISVANDQVAFKTKKKTKIN